MIANSEPNQQATPSAPTLTKAADPMTPALVREVADKVYALLLADLQFERERLRGIRQGWQKGGIRP